MEKSIALTFIVFGTACSCLFGCARKEAVEEVKTKTESKDTLTLSPKAVQRFGFSTVTVQSKEHSQPITSTGQIVADENKVFHISSLSNGRVVSDTVMLGDVIHAGQKMAIVQNLEVSKIYGDYIHTAHQNDIDARLEETRLELAKKNYDRIKKLFEEKISAEKDMLKAEADYKLSEETLRGLHEHATHIREEARVMLAAYGVTLGSPNTETIVSNSNVIAPRTGVIIKKNVTVGDVVTNSEPLYVVADLSQVWLDIAIYDKQVEIVKTGDKVKFISDSLPGRVVSGRISYIKPLAEDKTGTFVARAVVANPNLDLKPGMIGQVEIQSLHSPSLAYLPETAVQKYGNESFVFIEQPNGSYKRQAVVLGDHLSGGYFITSGIRTGERVVDKGSFTLKAEMLKSTTSGAE